MIWLTWRQLRTQAVVVCGALAVVAVALAITGGELASLYRASESDFLELVAADRGDTTLYIIGFAAVIVLPGVIGAFWGAPLVARELEAGTHRLVWNQTVTRSRWLATKLGLTGLVAVGAVGLLTLAVTWWCGPIDQAVNGGYGDPTFVGQPRVSPLVFGARGIVPVAYTAFAFALGVAAGLVIRRTVTAMAVTLVVFVALQIAVTFWVRPHLAEPAELTTTITTSNLGGIESGGPGGPIERIVVRIDEPGAWVLSNQTVDPAGQVASSLPSWLADCLPRPPAPPPGRASLGACFDRLGQEGYRQQVTYHPASTYWRLQWTETAIYLGLAGLLSGLCFWWTRRRLS